MYKMILLISIILCIIAFVFLLININKVKKEKSKKIKKDFEELYKIEEKKYKDELKLKKEQFEEYNAKYDSEIEATQKAIEREESKRNLILNQKEEIINKELEIKRMRKEEELQTNIVKRKKELEAEYENFLGQILKEKEDANEELEELKELLEEYRAKREVVNNAILREKEIQEKENFFKINITQNDIEDMKILKEIEYKMKNREALTKLIYDVYIKKPSQDLIKRILCGRAPSGIYKITYLPTGESYVGKSTNIKSRWEQHIKSCFGLGTIAHSTLHTKMARDGIWNFSFEVLEEVEKDKLGEREKYWIDFYNTKKYGMNERNG